MSKSGVYAIRQRSTGRVYIGSSVNMPKRWMRHRTDLNCNRHHAPFLQRAWSKHGADDFDFLVIETAPKDRLRTLEAQHLANALLTFNTMRPDDMSGVIEHSAETRQRMSEAQKRRGMKLTPEHKARMLEARRLGVGWTTTEETRAKISAAVRSRPPPSAETREKLRQANYRRVYPPMSMEQRAKLSAIHRARHAAKKESS